MNTVPSETDLGQQENWYLPDGIRERILAHQGSIMVLPEVALKALALVRDIESSIHQVAELISQDMKLATDILSMANSPIYSTVASTANLTDAIARLGFGQCRNLILSSSLHSAMNSLELEDEWIRDVLTRHSMLTGTIASNLNRILRAGFSGEEFAAGMVHDFGRLLLASVCGDEFRSIDPLEFIEDEHVIAREREAIGTDHCEAGAWFMAGQGLPDVLCDVARFHHMPENSHRFSRLCALVATADHMANHCQRVGETDGYDPDSNTAVKLLEDSGVARASASFRQIAEELLERSTNDVREITAC